MTMIQFPVTTHNAPYPDALFAPGTSPIGRPKRGTTDHLAKRRAPSGVA
jgi:hypothetical protein